MRRYFKHLIFYFTFSSSTLSLAGGPLIIEGPDGNTPVTYEYPNIILNVENGDLGVRPNAIADILVQEAIDIWNNVNSSTINLIKDEDKIPVDINIDNFEDYLPNLAETSFHASDKLNPVVYDDNGEIIDAYFGMDSSEDIIGFAASIFTTGSRYFDEGYAVINGKDLNLTNRQFKLLIAHEIGHFFGLDHSQADINNQEKLFGFPGFCNSPGFQQSDYPVMYPFACRDDETNPLHPDDISAISALYPNSAVPSNFGTLSGRLLDSQGKAILGANIWAEHNDGRTFSIVSDYLLQQNGYFELLLPPGNYTLHANSINTEFFAGSSVGPYAITTDDVSFSCLGYFDETDYEGNTPGSPEVITIAAGETITDINFSLPNVVLDECEVLQSPSNSTNFSSGGSSSSSPILLSILTLLLLIVRVDSRQK